MKNALHLSIASTMKWLLALYLVCLTAGMISWLGGRKDSVTPALSPHAPEGFRPKVEANWASYHKGARVRVSSWDPFRSHHPLFAIDEMKKPTREAKWQSEAYDREPWIEVLFARPVDLREVQLDFAGVVESGKNNMQAYQIYCHRAGTEVSYDQMPPDADVMVSGNRKSRATHRLECAQTSRLRVQFDVEPLRRNRDRVRLYEIRALGEVR